MNAQAKDRQLLERAVEKLADTTGVRIKILAHDHEIAEGRQFDALMNLETAAGTTTYAVETKRHLTTATLGLAAAQLKAAPYKGILIADYVNPNMAERLKAMDLAFADLAGNAYLNEPPVFVYIKGNRLADKNARGRTQKPTRAFHATGLQVVFGFLTNPELVDATYRDIAAKTNVALGTVALVFTDLREHGFVFEEKGKPRRLLRKREIMEAWVRAYPEKLRPKLALGRYQAPAPDWWKTAQLEEYEAQWGAEVAAALLTDYLIPEQTTIYAVEVPAKLLVENRLKNDPEGDVEIVQRFWEPGALKPGDNRIDVPPGIVPPLLVYADLLATADDRNVETAKLIYERFLDGHLG